jgi:hypothetical protein
MATKKAVSLTTEISAEVAEKAGGEQFVRSVLLEKQKEALTLISKQADYGPKNISACPIGPIPGVIVRLFDKISRLSNLTKVGGDPKHESLYDTTHDIANYGTIGSLVINGEWPE